MSEQRSREERAKLSPAERLKLLEQSLGELSPAERQALGQSLLGQGAADPPADQAPPVMPSPRPKPAAKKVAISQFSLGEDRTNPAKLRKQLWSCLALVLLIMAALVGLSYGFGRFWFWLIE